MASPSPASSSSPSLPPQPPPPSSRRLPPPCWSNDETGALVEAYRGKWATLRRGNLKAADWQDVADAVASRCGPSKTALQCRHKIEKLRKRYRNEKRRLLSSASHRASSWIHYLTFDVMESSAAPAPASASRSKPSLVTVARAPPPPPSPSSSSEEDEDDRSAYRVMSIEAGARFRTPKTEQISNFSGKSDSFLPKSTMEKYLLPSKKRPVVRDAYDDPAMEVVWAIRQLGEGFLRVEKMKMEAERMRAEMEMERTEMILASQQQILLSLGSRRMKRLKTTSNGKI